MSPQNNIMSRQKHNDAKHPTIRDNLAKIKAYTAMVGNMREKADSHIDDLQVFLFLT